MGCSFSNDKTSICDGRKVLKVLSHDLLAFHIDFLPALSICFYHSFLQIGDLSIPAVFRNISSEYSELFHLLKTDLLFE